jgi:hypothetical protein
MNVIGQNSLIWRLTPKIKIRGEKRKKGNVSNRRLPFLKRRSVFPLLGCRKKVHEKNFLLLISILF